MSHEVMIPSLEDDTLVFMHLPKTGGTALRASLLRAFDTSATALIYPSTDLDASMTRAEFVSLSREALDRLRLVMGHFQFGIHEQIGRPSRYATIIRDPVDRVVSLYYHYRNLPGIRFGGKGHRERLRMRLTRTSMEDWVFQGDRRTADNVAIRNITGRGDVPFGQCTDGLFDEAMERIDRHFIALLATERMSEGAILMSRIIERDLPQVGVENANPKRPALEELDPSVIERVRELNRYDLRLHQLALGRLEGVVMDERRAW